MFTRLYETRELIPSIGLAFCLRSFCRVFSSHSALPSVWGNSGPTRERIRDYFKQDKKTGSTGLWTVGQSSIIK